MDMSQLLTICSLVVVVLLPTTRSGNSGFYVDTDDKTVLMDKLSRRQQKVIREEMLNILGLEREPKLKRNKGKSAPDYMLDLYRQFVFQAEHGDTGAYVTHQNEADLVISFVNHVNKQTQLRHDRNRMFYFDFGDVPSTEAVCRAKLRMYKHPAEPEIAGSSFNIAVFRIVKDSFESAERLEPEVNLTVSAAHTGWLDFNVTGAATDWTYFPVTNLGLYMEITDQAGVDVDPRQAGVIGRRGSDNQQPFLVSYFRSGKLVRTRSRRGADTRPKRREPEHVSYKDNPMLRYMPKRKRCQKRALFVSFRDLKWQEWIISPKGYAAFYCFGQCTFPLNSHMNATNHAIVQTLVHLKRESIPEPCCAPTKLSALSVLYFDERSNVILKNYQNMVVKSCGCH